MSAAPRYSVQAVLRARELRKAGWTYAQIARILHRELGVSPTKQTVACWVNDDYRSMNQRASRRGAENRRRRRNAKRVVGRVSEEWKLARMRELRDAGMPYRWIGVAAGIWWDCPLSERAVTRLLAMSEPIS